MQQDFPVTGNREQGVVWRIGQRGNHRRGVVNHRLPGLEVAPGFSRTVVLGAVANPSAKEINLLGRKRRLAEGHLGLLVARQVADDQAMVRLPRLDNFALGAALHEGLIVR